MRSEAIKWGAVMLAGIIGYFNPVAAMTLTIGYCLALWHSTMRRIEHIQSQQQ